MWILALHLATPFVVAKVIRSHSESGFQGKVWQGIRWLVLLRILLAWWNGGGQVLEQALVANLLATLVFVGFLVLVCGWTILFDIAGGVHDHPEVVLNLVVLLLFSGWLANILIHLVVGAPGMSIMAQF